MNRTKLILSAVVLGSIFLTGCASNSKIDQLSTEVQTIGSKVDQLGSEVSSLHADVQTAKDEAARANMRLDNLAHKYKK